MTLKEWLDKWSMTSLKINAHFLTMEWKPNDLDKTAAWEMYVELITRVTTQQLTLGEGDEESALSSIYQLFGITRHIIKQNGRLCTSFTKLAIIILNQKIRPFTAKWHQVVTTCGISNPELKLGFREELTLLQSDLREYTRMLADIAGVEDLTDIEIT